MRKKIKKSRGKYLGAPTPPEDQSIRLFAGLLPNPDMVPTEPSVCEKPNFSIGFVTVLNKTFPKIISCRGVMIHTWYLLGLVTKTNPFFSKHQSSLFSDPGGMYTLCDGKSKCYHHCCYRFDTKVVEKSIKNDENLSRFFTLGVM